jgi:phage-related protein
MASLATTHFVALMNEMRQHYKANPGVRFNAVGSPHHIQMLAAGGEAFGSGELPSEFETIKSDAKSALSSSADEQKTGITTNTSNLQSTKNSSDFAAKMKAQRDAAKASSDKVIDDTYEKAINLGTDNPAAQGAIAAGMDFISNAVGSVVNVVSGLISSLMDEIKKILDGILKPIEQIAGAFGQVTSILSFL